MTETETGEYWSRVAQLAERYPRGSTLRGQLSLVDRHRVACFEQDRAEAQRIEREIARMENV